MIHSFQPQSGPHTTYPDILLMTSKMCSHGKFACRAPFTNTCNESQIAMIHKLPWFTVFTHNLPLWNLSELLLTLEEGDCSILYDTRKTPMCLWKAHDRQTFHDYTFYLSLTECLGKLYGVATISRLLKIIGLTCRTCLYCYGVATISRLLKIIGLFCRISSLS